MLAITDLTGETRLLTGVKQVNHSRKVNGEKTITFLAVPNENNKNAFDTVTNESIVTFENEPYVIKKVQEKSVGNTYLKSVEAVHQFFNEMINSFQYDLHTGSQTFFAALTRVFQPTPYTFSIEDTFTAETFENFGRDSCLSLFKNVLERYQAEFEVVGYQVYLKRKIGEDTGFQLRWKHNIKAIDKEVDTQDLSTVIKGFGGKPSEEGVYPIQREYRSNVDRFGEKHAAAVYDESTSTAAGMDAKLKRTLVDEPQLSITVDIATVEGDVKNEGDRGFIIYEPMNIEVAARAVELAETYEIINKKWRVVKTAVTLSNFKNRLSDTITRFGQTTKKVDRLFNGTETLPFSVLPEAMRIAAEAINNSLTEVQYPAGQGIVLQDPNNKLLMVRLTSAGIGLSTDGGVTYRSALTGAGIVTNELVAGIIRTNNIQIVGEKDLFYWNGEGLFAYDPSDLSRFVRINSKGIYMAKGSATIERPDGHKVISNGMSVYDVNIQAITKPMFHGPGVVEIQKGYSVWMRSRSTTSLDYNQYRFKRDARYLKIRFRLLAGGGNTAHLEIWRNGSLAASAFTSVTDEYDPSVINGSTLTVDMGVPDGQRDTFQIRMRSSVDGADVLAIVSEYWQEG